MLYLRTFFSFAIAIKLRVIVLPLGQVEIKEPPINVPSLIFLRVEVLD